MSNYSDNEGSVRVVFFRESGKWYATEAVDMTGLFRHALVDEALRTALKRHLWMPDERRYRYQGMRAVCLEPYNERGYPIMLTVGLDWGTP